MKHNEINSYLDLLQKSYSSILVQNVKMNLVWFNTTKVWSECILFEVSWPCEWTNLKAWDFTYIACIYISHVTCFLSLLWVERQKYWYIQQMYAQISAAIAVHQYTCCKSSRVSVNNFQSCIFLCCSSAGIPVISVKGCLDMLVMNFFASST